MRRLIAVGEAFVPFLRSRLLHLSFLCSGQDTCSITAKPGLPGTSGFRRMFFRNANARLLTWGVLIQASLLRGNGVYQHAKKSISVFSTKGVREFPVAVVQGPLGITPLINRG